MLSDYLLDKKTVENNEKSQVKQWTGRGEGRAVESVGTRSRHVELWGIHR